MERKYFLEPRFDSHKSFYQKAIVVENDTDRTVTLYSYKTRVCQIRWEGDERTAVVFNVPMVFSSTSLRHIKEFLKQNCFEASSKSQIENDYLEEI